MTELGDQHVEEAAVVRIETEVGFSGVDAAAACVETLVARLRDLTPRWFTWHPGRAQRVELLAGALAPQLPACEVGRGCDGATCFMGLRCRSGPGHEEPGLTASVELDPAYRPDDLRACVADLLLNERPTVGKRG